MQRNWLQQTETKCGVVVLVGGLVMTASGARAEVGEKAPGSESAAPILLAQAAVPPALPNVPPAADSTQSTKPPAVANTAAPSSAMKIGGFTVTGSLRTRLEHWNFFDAPGFNDSYNFVGSTLRVGLAKQSKNQDINVELAAPFLFNLPENAIAPPPQGQLGLGASYRAASGGRDGSIFLKQAFVRFKGLGAASNSLRLGRFEFWDGSEVAPKNAALAFIKRERINHRLIGNFGFSHVGRSYDGAQFVHNTPSSNITVMAARPTEGVFQLNGLGGVKDVDFAYAAYTRPMKTSEMRLFGLLYRDGRNNVVKVDNRPAPVRAADNQNIQISTVGAHYLKSFDMGQGTGDLLLWGALQGGDWGTQSHSANALAIEAGYQPKNSKLKPWLRAGYYRGSGDKNPADGRHNSFFSVLPTPRIYARFPFYNQMNNEDLFAQLYLRPNPKLTVRSDFHSLRLSSANDLFYSGGGAFQDNTFGYAGRPNPSGAKSLANIIDISVDYALNPETTLTFYVAQASGKSVINSIFPSGSNGRYAYIEATRKF